MKAALRAAVSILMLAGFYVVALIQLVLAIVVAIGLAYLFHQVTGVRAGAWTGLFMIGGAALGVVRAMRVKQEPKKGVPLSPSTAMHLWHAVRTIAAEIGTREPDEIVIIAEVNAAVSEKTRLLGLLGGARTLYIGLPLLQAFSLQQLRAVLAHELGHYSRHHTRLGAIAYRGRVAVEAAVGQFSRLNPVAWGFRAYARLYRLVDSAASRAQEFEADRAAVRVVGPEATASALRELPVVEAAWNFYFDKYVAVGWEMGLAPADLFGGFGEILTGRKAALEKLRAEEPEPKRSRWDTHPPIAVRIKAIADAPRVPVPVFDRPATSLLPDLDRVAGQLQQSVVDVGDRTVLPWNDFTATVITESQQRSADRYFRALAHVTGREKASLPELLDLVEVGRLAELTNELFPGTTSLEATPRFIPPMTMLISLAAIRSGTASWRHSWSGPASLVDRDGRPVDYEDVAGLAVSPDTLAEARARLVELGISVERTTVVEATVSGRGAGVVTAIADVKIDGVNHDVIVLSRGFVLVPVPAKASDGGSERLEKIVGSGSPSELVERNRFLPFEEIATVEFIKRVPARVRLATRGGTTIAMDEGWGSASLGKSGDRVFREVLEHLAQRSATRP
jgi:Zn-dependent protease with chaperone function